MNHHTPTLSAAMSDNDQSAPVAARANLDFSGLLTGKQIAATYHVSNSTFLRWYHEGIVPAAVAVGQVLRFDPEDVAKAIAKHTAKQNRENRARADKTAAKLTLGR